DDRLFGGLDGGEEERPHRLVRQQRDRARRFLAVADAIGGGEGDDVVAAAVVAGRTRSREAHDAALGHALQVARVDRRVGGDDNDARAAGGTGGGGGDGHAGDGEVAAEVRLHQHAHGVAARAARRRADAALESEGDRAGAGADGAFLHGSATGG